MLNSYERRLAARKTRLLDFAEQARAQSDAVYERTNELARHLPPGQPVLTDHYSAGPHRRFLENIRRGDRRWIELDNKALEYERRASAVGEGGISVIDPDALTKLRAEHARLIADQQRMKAVNRCVQIGDSEGAAAMLTSWEIVNMSRDGKVCRGFSQSRTKNNGANIRRIANRIKELESLQAREDVEIKGVTYVYREEVDEISFEFRSKPDDETLKLLKSYGFRWAPTRGMWVRLPTARALADGRYLQSELERIGKLSDRPAGGERENGDDPHEPAARA